MNELALFAGAGGGILGGVLLGWHCVGAVEIEKYPRKVLLARQCDGLLPEFPIWDDVCTFDGKPWRGLVDIITGGFPCQDISAAGKGAGINGERSGLWAEMHRIICEVRPRFAFMENSPMLTSRGFGRVLGDLAEIGYDACWTCLSAADCGAPHKRERICILAMAHPELQRLQGSHPRPAESGGATGGGQAAQPQSAGGMFPTPQVADTQFAYKQTPESIAKRAERHQLNLAHVVQLLPTPTCQDAKNNGSQSQQERNSKPLNAVAGGALNPDWVEWLMGWPIGWTALKLSETDRFQSWLQQHSESFTAN